MAYCSKCGAEISESAAFCSGCGAPVAETGQQQTATDFGTQPNDDARTGFGTQPNDKAQPDFGTQPNDKAQPDFGTQPNDNARPGFGTQPNDNARPGFGTQPNAGFQSNSYGRQSNTRPGIAYNNLAQDAQANKIFGVLAYIGFLVFVTILAAPKESWYSRYHANQGLVLFIADVACAVVLKIITAILMAVAGFIGFGAFAIFGLISSLLWGAYSIILLVFVIMGIVNAVNGKLVPLPVIGSIQILK
jgi:uncharacterized membrane protein